MVNLYGGSALNWLYVLAAAFVVWLLLSVYHWGYSDAEQKYRALMAAQAQKQAEQARKASESYQRERMKLLKEHQENERKIEEIIEQGNVYRHRCFDDDGLRELRRAIKQQ